MFGGSRRDRTVRRQLAIAAAAGGIALASSSANAQLRTDEVLVVYDSRIPESQAVAEMYAGSRPMGLPGSEPGLRRGVRVVNLAALGAPAPPTGTISYPDFVTRLRTPLQTYLTSTGLSKRVRCLVMTKGLPHRVQDTDAGDAGDNPGVLVQELTANDSTSASVDAELTLLWQELNTGEAGGPSDSKADGLIQNPYWKAVTPIQITTQANNEVDKLYTASGIGPVWLPAGSVGVSTRLAAGDIYLVCRLDAPSLADVRGMIERARRTYYDIPNSALLLDESDSDGVANGAANAELDNSSSGFPNLWDSDDYERTRDETNADGRMPALTRYNALGGGAQFFVGPRIVWQPPGAITITQNVVLVASLGSNHTGRPRRDSDGALADTFYATSFNYGDGAIFNTIESYNGRDFGGLGLGSTPQQQASSFLAAGGTYAIGNVWEPIADSVPDNRYLARNFIRGTLSWAEASWSSIPALSWMQISVGDPLGRAQRSSEDIDANRRVNVDDLYAWEAFPRDINASGAADATDRAFVVNALRSWERSDIESGRQ